MENGKHNSLNPTANMARATVKVRVIDDPDNEDEFLDQLEVSEVSCTYILSFNIDFLAQ
jgi:hypothetical protein